MKYPPVQSRTVLITGCSSGIGAATAHVLRDRGWHVFPTARKPADLEELTKAGFDAMELDIADSASVNQAADALIEKLGGTVGRTLGAIVNNAGFGQAGAVEDLSRETLRYQFEVNVFGMQELTNRFIPFFRKQGYGRVVNISSVLGRVSIPMTGAYCATKFAMEALSDSLRVELRDTGVAVSLVEPGPIVSRFRNNAAEMAEKNLNVEESRFGQEYAKEITRRKNQQKKPDFFTLPPEAVATKITHALESSRPRIRYCVTIPAYGGAFLSRFAPASLLDRMLASKVTR